MKILLAAFSFGSIGVSSASADSFHLICHGVGSQVETATTFGSVRTNDGGFASGSASQFRRGRTPDDAVVEIDEGVSRIQVPESIIPGLHGGGSEGWWPLNSVEVSDIEVRGRFSMNALNKPKVIIDRRTGQIVIDGLGRNGFRGVCEPFNPAQDARKF